MAFRSQATAYGSKVGKKLINRGTNVVKYQRPSGITPWALLPEGPQNGTVWIKMKPRKILDQYSKISDGVRVEEVDTEFMFLAPLNLNENIVHHWEAYESVASRLAQKVRSAVKLGSEVRAMGQIADRINLADVQKAFENSSQNEGQSIEQYIAKAYRAVPSSRIPNIKVDTPLYYSNSDRRQIVFEFQLFHENVSSNPEDALINPIQELMKYSSPDLISDINIEFPYMWDVRTYPNEFIKYTTCALVGVQPTWNSPYIYGVPSNCNLQLTFMDLSPLYAGTIERGSLVNVISSEDTNAKRARGQKASNQGIPVLRAANSRSR